MSKFIAFKKLIKDQDGAALAEYAVLMAVVLAIAVGSMTNLATEINRVIQAVATFIGTIK